MTKFYQFMKNDSGATAIEYGLLAALIAVVIIGSVRLVGQDVDNAFNSVATAL